jgi:hypothetical protein
MRADASESPPGVELFHGAFLTKLVRSDRALTLRIIVTKLGGVVNVHYQ